MKVVKPGDQVPEPSPKLQMAKKEILDILTKYDIAGYVQLFTPGHTEYSIHISPSFSCVRINDVGQLQINAPIEDPQNPAPAKKKVADTVNMVANLRIYVGKMYQTLTQADLAVRSHFGMMPKPGPPAIGNGKQKPN